MADRDVAKFAKGMKMGTGKKEAGEGIVLRPHHMVNLMKDADTGEQHACPHCGEDIPIHHEAEEGEDEKYHEAVGKFKDCYMSDGESDDRED